MGGMLGWDDFPLRTVLALLDSHAVLWVLAHAHYIAYIKYCTGWGCSIN